MQRDGLEYEFDVVADLDQDNNLIVGKTRCPAVAGMVIPRAGKEVAQKLLSWLSDGSASESAAKNGGGRLAAPIAAAKAPAEDFKADAIHCHCGITRVMCAANLAQAGCAAMPEPISLLCDFRLKDARRPTEILTKATPKTGADVWANWKKRQFVANNGRRLMLHNGRFSLQQEAMRRGDCLLRAACRFCGY